MKTRIISAAVVIAVAAGLLALQFCVPVSLCIAAAALSVVAVYEMLFDPDVPTGVAINEAVELAKQFGGDDSASFINGILGKIAAAHEKKEASAEQMETEKA